MGFFRKRRKSGDDQSQYELQGDVASATAGKPNPLTPVTPAPGTATATESPVAPASGSNTAAPVATPAPNGSQSAVKHGTPSAPPPNGQKPVGASPTPDAVALSQRPGASLADVPGLHGSDEHYAVISVRDLTKTYQMGEVEVAALQGVDLDIYAGEMTAIMGPSGSGKSTLMNIIGCLDVPTSGTYTLDEIDVSRLTDDELAEIRGRKIGFVFQNFNLLSRTTALANVELPLIYIGVNGRQRHKLSRESLELVGLGERLHHKPNELSGGQQQRVAIARALVNEPALILADEPTGNLDSKTSVEIMELFQRLNVEKGITIVFVTHNVETADYCNRVVHVRDGKIERDVRHQPRAGIYRDLLPADMTLEMLRIQAAEVQQTPTGLPSAMGASAGAGESATP
jgi:putative ABC transport system ATP-binding protein